MAKETVASLSTKLDALISALGESTPVAQDTSEKIEAAGVPARNDFLTFQVKDGKETREAHFLVVSTYQREGRATPMKFSRVNATRPTGKRCGMTPDHVRAIGENQDDILAALDAADQSAGIGQYAS